MRDEENNDGGGGEIHIIVRRFEITEFKYLTDVFYLRINTRVYEDDGLERAASIILFPLSQSRTL